MLMFSLVGCGSAPTANIAQAAVVDARPAAGATTQPAPVVTAPPAPTAQPASAVAIRFERSGGFAGQTSSYTILADGTVLVGARLARDAAQTLPAPGANAMADLLANIAATNITAVSSGDYSPENTCCDRFAYTLSLSLSSGTYTYATLDAAQNQPAALAEAIALVQAYIEAAQPRS